jgi:hypothetical protein
MNKIRITCLAFGLTLGLAAPVFAQDNPPPRGDHRGHRPHGPEPIVRALDTDKDGVISAAEIANAPKALLTLDKNGDGKLSADEIRPPRPADAPPPPDAPKHPVSPVMLALDANGDGELSPAEIANAAVSLAALDANHDGKLTIDELRPLPPPGAPHDGPPRE